MLKKLERLQWDKDCAGTSMPAWAVPKTKFRDTDTNSLTRAVMAWLIIHGCQAERVANKGTYIQGKEVKRGMYGLIRTKGKYIPGSGRNGTSDVHSTIPVVIGGKRIGLSVKWEIKCIATKDKVRPDQVEYAKEVEDAGGLVFFIHSFDEFIQKWEGLLDVK